MTPLYSTRPARIPLASSSDILETILEEIPFEGTAFLAAALAARFFFPLFTAPLLGIGLSLTVTRLAIKFLGRYDRKLMVDLTKEACKLHREYPNLQLICFLFSLSIALLSKTLGFLAGAAAGSFGAVILDVENYKRLQQIDRKKISL